MHRRMTLSGLALSAAFLATIAGGCPNRGDDYDGGSSGSSTTSSGSSSTSGGGSSSSGSGGSSGGGSSTPQNQRPDIRQASVEGSFAQGRQNLATALCSVSDADGRVTNVRADLSAIGGSSNQSLTKDSQVADLWGWSGSITPPSHNNFEPISIRFTATDDDGASDTYIASVRVGGPDPGGSSDNGGSSNNGGSSGGSGGGGSSGSSGNGPSGADCDYDWTGTEFENNCPLAWMNDGDCDCGCQFVDPLCNSGTSGGGNSGANCDYDWTGTPYENNCPMEWMFDNDCDCGCQFVDPLCASGGGSGGGGTVSQPIVADFRSAVIQEENCSVSTTGAQFNPPNGGNWRLVYPGQSSIQVTFSMSSVPSSARLRLTHLTSAASNCPGGGYSPVDILINGSVFRNNWDVAENHGYSHGFEDDSFDITSRLRAGSNTVRIELEDDPFACTHYWIQMLEIDH